MTTQQSTGRRIRRITAVAVASTFMTQNFALAICSDGLGMPPGIQGYTVGGLPPSLANMAPNIFTGTAGSVFIPDNSINEGNDPNQPLTGHGHNWVFDQGSTTCKETDIGPAGQPATSWSIPPNTTSDCFVLPIVKGGIFKNFGDIPLQGQAIVPTCNPANLSAVGAPNPLNTRFNQLGCSISQLFNGTPVANDPTTAPAYLFIAGIMGGIFAEELENTPAGTPGDSGRVVSSIRYYSDIPEGSKLTNAMVDSTAHFVLATSIRRNPNVFGCLNPLGDPGDITLPIPDIGTFANSFDPSSANPLGVKCLSSIAQSGLQVTLTNAFGPDDQPYLGGQRSVTSVNTSPGSHFLTTAWPQCIVNGKGTGFVLTNPINTVALDAALRTVFKNHSNGGCGTFIANAGFSANPVIQPQTMIRYTAPNGNKYMFATGVGQPTEQFALGTNADGSTNYRSRTYFSGGTGFTTGLGVANDMNFTGSGAFDSHGNPTPAPGANGEGSLIVMQDPTGLNLAGQEVMTRLPLCSDF